MKDKKQLILDLIIQSLPVMTFEGEAEILASKIEKKINDSILKLTDRDIENWAAKKVNEIDPNDYGYGDLLIEGAIHVRDYYENKIKSLNEDYPEVDFRIDIVDELSYQECKDRLVELNETYQKLRKEWFEMKLRTLDMPSNNC